MELEHIDNVDPSRRAQWKTLCNETTLAMQDYCMRYITPISHAIDDEWGRLEGPGAYIEFGGRRLLLTNEHVLRDWETRQFTHQFNGCEDIFKLRGHPLALEKHPIDCAAWPIEDNIWNMRSHSAQAVPPERIAQRHRPLAGELLFFAGYPEKRSKSLYRNLITRATRLLTQELPNTPIPDLHTNYFLLNYSPEKAESVDPMNDINLSEPHGLSGSLVWNTRRLECLQQGIQWTPDLAQVTGLICRWDSTTSTVIAIRIEIALEFLARHTAYGFAFL